MKLIVGLGNPGEKYTDTRHNAGFLFVDYVYANSEVIKPWKTDKYAYAEVAEIQNSIILAKPQTFMNLSGKSVTELFKRYSLSAADLIVAHDDLDFKLGDFKVSLGKGPKLHNGITSVEKSIKNINFFRIRIGVDNRSEPINGEQYVLQNFKPEELIILSNSFPQVSERLKMSIGE